MFNPRRLEFALYRRGLSIAALAERLEVTTRTIRNYLASTSKSEPDVQLLEKILKFPANFFMTTDDLPVLDEDQVSFRANSRTSARLKRLARTYGVIAFMLNNWLEERFELKKADLPDLSEYTPEHAAQVLRGEWGLGIRPITNMVELLESKGIRIFSLEIETSEVDAFCAWNNSTPFIFLNNQKSAERSRFDSAHELGHLVRDIHNMKHEPELLRTDSTKPSCERDLDNSRNIEKNANEFASAFLMPKEALLPLKYQSINSIEELIKLKSVFGVSLTALAYRLYKLEIISEWMYTRILLPQIARLGYRKKEPQPMARDTSRVWAQLFTYLDEDKISIIDIAKELNIDSNDIEKLTFGLVNNKPHSIYHLRMVK